MREVRPVHVFDLLQRSPGKLPNFVLELEIHSRTLTSVQTLIFERAEVSNF